MASASASDLGARIPRPWLGSEDQSPGVGVGVGNEGDQVQRDRAGVGEASHGHSVTRCGTRAEMEAHMPYV